MSLPAAALLLTAPPDLPTPARLLSPLPERIEVQVDQRPTTIGVGGTLEVLVDPAGRMAGWAVYDIVQPEGARPGGSVLPCLQLQFGHRFAPAIGRDGRATWGLWLWSFRFDERGRLQAAPLTTPAEVEVSAMPTGRREARVELVLDVSATGTIDGCWPAPAETDPIFAPLACPAIMRDQPVLRLVRPLSSGEPVATIRVMTVRFTAAE